MKAYIVADKNGDSGYCTIVFGETRGKAIKNAMLTDACEGYEFTEIHARRVPALDSYYRGDYEMDWFNAEDRIAMVKEANMHCSCEVDINMDKCIACPAHEWCERYEFAEKRYNALNETITENLEV